VCLRYSRTVINVSSLFLPQGGPVYQSCTTAERPVPPCKPRSLKDIRSLLCHRVGDQEYQSGTMGERPVLPVSL